MRLVVIFVLFCGGLVAEIAGQGQIPPGRRKPPFVIIPPENERIKSAASERVDVTVPFQDAPEVVLPPLPSEDDSLFVPTKNPPLQNSKRPEFVPQEVPFQPEIASQHVQQVDVNRVLDRKCYNCICQASTNCSTGLTSCITTGPNQYFCGAYHISWAYWADSGKPGDVNGDPTAFEHCLLDEDCAERSVLGYMTKFQRDCNQDGVIDCVDFVLIHKMGPQACIGEWVYKTAYWQRFVQCWGSGLDFRLAAAPGTGK